MLWLHSLVDGFEIGVTKRKVLLWDLNTFIFLWDPRLLCIHLWGLPQKYHGIMTSSTLHMQDCNFVLCATSTLLPFQQIGIWHMALSLQKNELKLPWYLYKVPYYQDRPNWYFVFGATSTLLGVQWMGIWHVAFALQEWVYQGRSHTLAWYFYILAWVCDGSQNRKLNLFYQVVNSETGTPIFWDYINTAYVHRM